MKVRVNQVYRLHKEAPKFVKAKADVTLFLEAGEEVTVRTSHKKWQSAEDLKAGEKPEYARMDACRIPGPGCVQIYGLQVVQYDNDPLPKIGDHTIDQDHQQQIVEAIETLSAVTQLATAN